jgi:hypothetical protein
MDIICDRFMEEEVIDEITMDRKEMVLIGLSYLSNSARHIDQNVWKITDF